MLPSCIDFAAPIKQGQVATLKCQAVGWILADIADEGDNRGAKGKVGEFVASGSKAERASTGSNGTKSRGSTNGVERGTQNSTRDRGGRNLAAFSMLLIHLSV